MTSTPEWFNDILGKHLARLKSRDHVKELKAGIYQYLGTWPTKAEQDAVERVFQYDRRLGFVRYVDNVVIPAIRRELIPQGEIAPSLREELRQSLIRACQKRRDELPPQGEEDWTSFPNEFGSPRW